VADNNLYFKSIIAPTDQQKRNNATFTYHTSGGAIQSLIINNQDTSKWVKASLPILTFLPFCKPQ
jgi:hypothetical protein